MLKDEQAHRRDSQLQLLSIRIGGLMQIYSIQLQALGVLEVVVLCVRRKLSTVKLVQLAHFALRLDRLFGEKLQAAQIARLMLRGVEVSKLGCKGSGIW